MHSINAPTLKRRSASPLLDTYDVKATLIGMRDDALCRGWREEEDDPTYIERLRRMTPEEKLQIMAALWRNHRHQIAAKVQALHPTWDESAIEKEVSRRILFRED